ncbi:MAG: 4-(cytidine 5'-diphospho)-2-C-methyl-D-erythritol kinase [Desulfobacterales bacterium]|nr:4-(cytidine 5'-diphospho)-2-C-methyl-D-erythritol kinase [Desulfobacterales bacterium]
MHEYLSPAKINLFLYVTGRRPDGYHELFSLMAPVDLCDRVSIRFEGKGVRISCNHTDVPEDETNLAHRAAVLFFNALEQKGIAPSFDGMDIRIEKKIPVGGGLGGGSSNAGTILLAMNENTGNPFSLKELMAMGVSLGADVPFFVLGRPAFASGVGEKLSPCNELPEFSVIIANPGVSASTVNVFKKLEFGLTFTPDYIMNTGSNALPFEKELNGREKLHNDLEGPACSLYPEISSAKKEMELLLQRSIYMSGSGSSLFALYSEHEESEKGFRALTRGWSGNRQALFHTRIRQR